MGGWRDGSWEWGNFGLLLPSTPRIAFHPAQQQQPVVTGQSRQELVRKSLMEFSNMQQCLMKECFAPNS